MRKNENKSFYHYKAIFYNDEGEEIDKKYYLTLKKIIEEFQCCRQTILTNLKEPDRNVRGGKFNNIKLYRVHEPVFIKIENPITT